MKQSLQSMWEIYTASWSEPDSARRLRMFEDCLDAQCTYTDPLTQVSGYAALSQYMSDFQKSTPGARFVTTLFKSHHMRSLVNWDMQAASGKVLSHGVSFAMYNEQGRLLHMTGFFDLPGSA